MANPPQARSDNERLSLGDRLYMVLDKLDERREEVAAVLPPDIKYETFHATVNQALRNNPDILDAAPMSIVNSCIKAAYDGLRLDGPDWWLHVRGSNTEPVVRVIAEAPTEAHAKELCDEAGALLG